jgi:hypothetical protein
LAYRNVLEVLACLAGGPEDIDAIDYSVMAQSDVLLDRVCGGRHLTVRPSW